MRRRWSRQTAAALRRGSRTSGGGSQREFGRRRATCGTPTCFRDHELVRARFAVPKCLGANGDDTPDGTGSSVRSTRAGTSSGMLGKEGKDLLLVRPDDGAV